MNPLYSYLAPKNHLQNAQHLDSAPRSAVCSWYGRGRFNLMPDSPICPRIGVHATPNWIEKSHMFANRAQPRFTRWSLDMQVFLSTGRPPGMLDECRQGGSKTASPSAGVAVRGDAKREALKVVVRQ